MSSSIRDARAEQRRQRAREQDEESSASEAGNTQRAQKRRKGKQRARDEDEEDDSDVDVRATTQRMESTQTQSMTQTLTANSIGSAAFKKKVHDFVKLALYHEYRKQPLRKDDINKKVLGGANAKVFSALYDEAQAILRDKFGMELVAMRARPDTASGAVEVDAEEAEATQGGKKKGKKSTPATKGFILRSVLSADLISLMNEPSPITIEGSAAHQDPAAPTGGEGDGTVDCGALIDWQKGDGGSTGGIALVGLMWVVLGTILVHDRVLAEDRLKTIFQDRLNIDDNTLLPYLSRDAVKRQITFDDFLKSLQKQHYLEKVKLTTVNQGEEHHELRWGPRADAEFGEKAVAEFMTDIMATRPPVEPESDDEDDVPRQGRGRGRRNGQQQNPSKERQTPEQRRAKMMDDIKQAAGSELLLSTMI